MQSEDEYNKHTEYVEESGLVKNLREYREAATALSEVIEEFNEIMPNQSNEIEEHTELEDVLAFIDEYQEVKRLKTTDTEITSIVEDRKSRKFVEKTFFGMVSKKDLFNQLQSIDSPYIQKVCKVASVGNDLFVLCEYVAGQSLRDRVKEHGPLQEDELINMMACICEALKSLHNASGKYIIHKDVNPNNIIMQQDKACLIDFGISRNYDENASKDTHILGTAGYAAPEQFGFQQTDARTDIYALGKALRFALTGKDPNEDAPQLSTEIKAVISKACELDPQNRFSCIEEFQEAFNACQIGPTLRVDSDQKESKEENEGEGHNEGYKQEERAKQEKKNKVRKPKSEESQGNKWGIARVIGAIWCLLVLASAVTTFASDITLYGFLNSLLMFLFAGLSPWIFFWGGFGITKRLKFFQTGRRGKIAIWFIAVSLLLVSLNIYIDKAFDRQTYTNEASVEAANITET